MNRTQSLLAMKLLVVFRYLNLRLKARHFLRENRLRGNQEFKVYYGCGDIAQPGYINIDVRWTPAVDLLGDLAWCRKSLFGTCQEVYLSHVLEHYSYPGRAMRRNRGTVLHALACVFDMLCPGGSIRVAVPDFARLSALYQAGETELYPRISGRICGEQDYRENLHKCVFDRRFLELCLASTGFVNISEWNPMESGLAKDSSFDYLQGNQTSLNLLAQKPMKI